MTPEGRVKVRVRVALNEIKAYWFMPVQRGYGGAALDFCCCINGRFVYVETKADKKLLNPRQCITARCAAEAGGLVFVVRAPVDIVHMLNVVRRHDTLRSGAVFDLLGSVEKYGELWCP